MVWLPLRAHGQSPAAQEPQVNALVANRAVPAFETNLGRATCSRGESPPAQEHQVCPAAMRIAAATPACSPTRGRRPHRAPHPARSRPSHPLVPPRPRPTPWPRRRRRALPTPAPGCGSGSATCDCMQALTMGLPLHHPADCKPSWHHLLLASNKDTQGCGNDRERGLQGCSQVQRIDYSEL